MCIRDTKLKQAGLHKTIHSGIHKSGSKLLKLLSNANKKNFHLFTKVIKIKLFKHTKTVVQIRIHSSVELIQKCTLGTDVQCNCRPGNCHATAVAHRLVLPVSADLLPFAVGLPGLHFIN